MYNVIKQEFLVNFSYDIFFTENMFSIKNKILINLLNKNT